jgi:hypothetical protein
MSDNPKTGLDAARPETVAQLAMVFDGWLEPAREDFDWIVKELASQRLVWERLFSIQASQLEPIETFDPRWYD